MRRKFQSAILIACSVLFITSCSNEKSVATVDMDAAKKDIQAMEDAYAAAEKAKDAKAIVAYYADDAISYYRNEEPAKGKPAIEARLADRLAKDTTGNTNVYKVVDLFADGNLLVEVGSWAEMNPSGAEINSGHYISCFEKRDGKYVCVRDMSAASHPPKQ
jgi:ketosteroid isomerase-like protein